MTVSDLSKGTRKPGGDGVPLTADEINIRLVQLSGWEVINGEIVKTYRFQNYYETVAFVNAAAWVSHREDHHSDMEIGYNQCRVRYSTHAVGGLSENDFICAAKMDALFEI